jgi:hypothetical protein
MLRRKRRALDPSLGKIVVPLGRAGITVKSLAQQSCCLLVYRPQFLGHWTKAYTALLAA